MSDETITVRRDGDNDNDETVTVRRGNAPVGGETVTVNRGDQASAPGDRDGTSSRRSGIW